MKKNYLVKKTMAKSEILAEAKKIRKQIISLKKTLRKIKAKAKPVAIRAWKLYDELDKKGKYDTKQKWLSKIVTDLEYWQDADHEIKLLIQSF